MVTSMKEMKIKSSVGIASGLVFCGTVGNLRRRELAVVGDSVNVAARLMGVVKETIVNEGFPIICCSITVEEVRCICIYVRCT